MHRLFVAIRPPAPVRQLLLAAMGGISGARWQSDDQLHLTLRFIGEVDRHLAGDIHAALGGVHHPPFALALNGIGCFDRRGFPDSVWAGVTPHEEVKALQKKVDTALRRVGLPPDERAFLPHITIARMNRSAGPVGALLEEAGGLSSPSFTVDSFALFESDLTHEAAVYSVMERYPLG
jgi:2'-5' RNA ligase